MDERSHQMLILILRFQFNHELIKLIGTGE